MTSTGFAADIDTPDFETLFDRLEPHLDEPAGPPVPGRTMLRSEREFLVGKPQQCMPAGGGDLSGMVMVGGDAVHIHLSKTDWLAFQERSNKPELLSPGRVILRFDGLDTTKLKRFDQRIDLAAGAVKIEMEAPEGTLRVEVAGDMRRKTLVVTCLDDRPEAGPTTVTYYNWRGAKPPVEHYQTALAAKDGLLTGRQHVNVKINRRPAEGDPREVDDPVYGLAYGVAIGLRDVDGGLSAEAETKTIDPQHVSLTLPKDGRGYFELGIASVSVNDASDPVAPAVDRLKATLGESYENRLKARRAWWREFWSTSWIDIQGPDAEYLARLWYVTLYNYACVGDGPFPPKFNAGPGLVVWDNRSWGSGFWWQNTREMLWPMGTAGHTQFMRRYLDFYKDGFATFLKEADKRALPGLWMPEVIRPRACLHPAAGGSMPPIEATDYKPLTQRERQHALELRQKIEPGYHPHNFSSASELVQQMFQYVQYTGDEAFAKEVAAPWLKETTIFYLGLMTRGPAGKWRALSANVNEQWWAVDDSLSLLCGIRYCLAKTVAWGERFGFEDRLIADARDRLVNMVDLPTVDNWRYGEKRRLEGVVPGDRLYAPFGMVGQEGKVRAYNCENPEVYVVFPYAMADRLSPKADYERAVATFEHRFCKNTAGWSQGGIQAARLALPETVDVIMHHANRHQTWPYGGWNSPAPGLYKGSGVITAPFFDSAGVNATAIQETLLQSHAPEPESPLTRGGPIALIPAVRETWSGRFKLHARGGFVVTAAFDKGKVTAARIESTRGEPLAIANPFEACRLTVNGGAPKAVKTRTISLDTEKGDVVSLAAGE